MKINGTSNNSFQNKVLLDTFVEQISALQEDVARLQDADVELDNKISQQLSEEEFNDFQANAHVSNLTAAEINSETGFIGHLNSTQADVENLEVNTHAEIQDLTALNANIPSLTTDDVTVQGDITSAGDITAKDAVLDNVSANKVETPLVEADLVKADVIAEDVETDTVTVKDKLTVKDIEVSGTVTGLSEINADSVNANEAEIETINTEHIRSWVSQVMNQEEALLPTPALGNIDRYTIELPKFNGIYLLSWEDQDIVWSATVIGNGKSYGISWGSRTDENFITDLFQYNGKLYIRVRSNGRLKFAYSATKELPQPVIYFNMTGWTSDKSLEELCDEKSHLINAYPVGMIWFGKVFIPKLETAEGNGGNGINFKGSCTLAGLPAFTDTEVGDVWNITEETYTDSRFVEGAGKPINAGDDVICVSVPEVPTTVHSTEMPTNTRGALVLNDKILIAGGNSIYSYVNGVVTKIATFSGEDEYVVFGKIKKIDNRIFALNTEYVQPYAYSDDNGETWQLYTDIYYDYVNLLGIYKVGNRTFMYSYSETDYYSDNNGDTWSELTTYVDGEMESIYNPIIQLPDGSLISFSTRYSDKHLIRCRSEDGINWVTTDTGFDLGEGYINDMSTVSYTTSGIFIEVYSNREYYLLKSTDNGLTFNRIDPEGYPTQQGGFLPLVETANGILYSYNYSMVSSDAGLSWEEVPPLLDDIEIGGSGGHIASPRYSFSFDVYPAVSGTFIIVPGIISEEARQVLGSTGEYVSKVNLFIAGSLKWDKFAAGVNYDNFTATNITASTALKSEGTLEVDGTSQFDDDVTVNADLNADKIITPDLEVTGAMTANSTGIALTKNVTHTGNYTQTGNQNITGNETVSGNSTLNNVTANTVIIGDLD